MADSCDRMRLDKWLWVARFFKTRSLASESIDAGKVSVNGVRAKRAREVGAGDEISFTRGREPFRLTVVAIAPNRGPAVSAQRLYSESEESVAARAALNEARRVAPEPASGRRGRPTKQDRRQIQRFRAS